MGMNGFLEAAMQRLSSATSHIRTKHRVFEPNPDAADPTVSPIEQAAIGRRRRERSSFADDAAYFEFLVERAIGDAVSSSTEPS